MTNSADPDQLASSEGLIIWINYNQQFLFFTT